MDKKWMIMINLGQLDNIKNYYNSQSMKINL